MKQAGGIRRGDEMKKYQLIGTLESVSIGGIGRMMNCVPVMVTDEQAQALELKNGKYGMNFEEVREFKTRSKREVKDNDTSER